MEIMEDGNLVDRVRILLQRDMQYYQAMQTVLRETVCVRVSGGKLDFPRHASFAAIKIVTWWEAEFCAAFRRPSGLSTSSASKVPTGGEEDNAIKTTPPSEFIIFLYHREVFAIFSPFSRTFAKCARGGTVTLKKDAMDALNKGQIIFNGSFWIGIILEHLHTLIQESLDHADLTVLTATLGAAALIRNCLWCYNQQSKDKIPEQSSVKLFECYKSYDEMAEAVAERLLDLHCRLISLYILNEADSLSWQNNKSFFEKERCSFTIQMWWLYMQGTKADLWNTVSPKMAQRVFAGMLNESLSIIATRFIHGRPSLARSEQFWADAFNVLCCSAYLTLSACLDADELIGLRTSKLSVVMRDIHAKCGELLVCLLLRGTPLRVLYQACRNGLENMTILQQRCGPAPWLLICAPKLFGASLSSSDYKNASLSLRAQLILEINVLRSQPQPNWTQLLKVFSMNDCAVARMLLSTLVRRCIGYTENSSSKPVNSTNETEGCGGFLCTGSSCDRTTSNSGTSPLSIYLYSIAYISVNTFMNSLYVIIPAIKQDANWSNYLDRQQVWNQARPPWLNALLSPLRSMIMPIVETLLEAVKTDASIYQAMSLTLACLTELFVCAPLGVLRAGLAMNDNLPAHCHPIGGSVILQFFCASLYSALLEIANYGDNTEKSPPESMRDSRHSPNEIVSEPSSFDPKNRSASATALAEAICSIDEDNKHTDQIDSLLTLIEEWIKSHDSSENEKELETTPAFIETYTDQLLFTNVGRRSLKIAHDYLIHASDWVLKNVEEGGSNHENFSDASDVFVASKPLPYIMFHIEEAAFDQFLINFNEADWQAILKTPLSGTVDRCRAQILLRPEFKNLENLTLDQKEVVRSMKQLASVGRSARFR